MWEQHNTQSVFMDTLMLDGGKTKCVRGELPQKQSNFLAAHKTKQYVVSAIDIKSFRRTLSGRSFIY